MIDSLIFKQIIKAWWAHFRNKLDYFHQEEEEEEQLVTNSSKRGKKRTAATAATEEDNDSEDNIPIQQLVQRKAAGALAGPSDKGVKVKAGQHDQRSAATKAKVQTLIPGSASPKNKSKKQSKT